jgi:hypothetical protein
VITLPTMQTTFHHHRSQTTTLKPSLNSKPKDSLFSITKYSDVSFKDHCFTKSKFTKMNSTTSTNTGKFGTIEES